MLEKLRNLNLDRIDLEEAVALSAFANMLRDEFENRNVEVPEWLSTRMRELSREVETRRLDAMEHRLKRAKALRETLKPTAERRKEVDKEIKELESQLS